MGSAQVLEPTVEFLAGLAGQGGRALELAIGTGRVALPLSARGVEVSGIELSPDMVAQLRSKPGGSEIPVTLGDLASVRDDGLDRKSVGSGKRWSVRLDLGGRRILKKKKKQNK